MHSGFLLAKAMPVTTPIVVPSLHLTGLTAWVKNLTVNSLCKMVWTIGEAHERRSELPTEPMPIFAGSFYLPVIRNKADLETMWKAIPSELFETEKYCRWFIGITFEELILILWCFGGSAATQQGTRDHVYFSGLISVLHSRVEGGKKLIAEAIPKALVDFEHSFLPPKPVAPVVKADPARVTLPTFEANSGPNQLTWIAYLTTESIETMLWAIGEVYVRVYELTLDKLYDEWSRVAGSFYGLILLGKQGNLPRPQYNSLYGRNPRSRGPLPELYAPQPQPADRPITIRNRADLQALVSPALIGELKLGKYSSWILRGKRDAESSVDVDTIILILWCIGGLVSTPMGQEFDAAQKHYSDILSAVHMNHTPKTKELIAGVMPKALADFATAFPSP